MLVYVPYCAVYPLFSLFPLNKTDDRVLMLQTCCPLDFVSSVSVALLHLSWYANSVYILLYSWFTMRLPLIFISTMELGRSPCYCVACCYSIKYLLPFPLLFFCKSSCFWPLEDGHSFSFFCIHFCLDLSSFFFFWFMEVS